MYVMSQYLATNFSALIPPHVIHELRREAAKAGRLEHLAALDGLRSEPQLRPLKLIAQASGWRTRGNRLGHAAAAAGIPQGTSSTESPPAAGADVPHPARSVHRQAPQEGRYRFRQRWLNSGRMESRSGLVAASAGSTQPQPQASIRAGRTFT